MEVGAAEAVVAEGVTVYEGERVDTNVKQEVFAALHYPVVPVRSPLGEKKISLFFV